MKLSYREKIGVIVLLVVCIIIIFVAWPIRLLRANIETHEAQKADVQVKYDNTKHLIEQIPKIEANITKVYNESKGIYEIFTVSRENFEVDKYIEEVINKAPYKDTKNTLMVMGDFGIDNKSVSEIPFYYYTPSVITYPILEAADTNGDLLKTEDEVLYNKVLNAVQMKALENQKVELHTTTIGMKFTKESLLKLEDELKASDTGLRITAVTIDDYNFGALSEIPDDSGYSTGTVSFSFYTMQQIEEPKFEN